MSDADPPEIRAQIRSFLEQYVDCAGAGDEEDLFAAGTINSLFAMQLVLFVEKQYGLRLQSSDLKRANFSSIAAIAGLVEGRQGRAG